MQISKAIAAYLADCRVGLAVPTVAVYGRNLERLAAALRRRRVRKLKAITPEHLTEYFSDLRGARGHKPQAAGGYSANTVHQHFRSVRTWLNWCVRRGLLARNPLLEVRAPPLPKPVARHIGLADMDRLLAATRAGLHPVRDWAIVLLFLDTGMRRKELADLTPADLNLAERLITIQLGKGARGRVVPISSPVCLALQRWIELRPPDRPTLFELGGMNIYQMIRRARARAGLERATPHMLRHSFATYYRGDIYDLARILGHADVSTTAAIYVHRDVARLASVHDERSPVGSQIAPNL